MTRRILVLYAHPAARRSRINRALREAAETVPGITVHDLYETYPDFAIDVDREQAQLDAHDGIVVQHPFFWYSAPAIVKEWLDLVLEHGWAYGRNGHHLDGKTWMQAVSVGGREQAYRSEGMNRYSVEELLRPFEATANLCRMAWERPFLVHAAHVAEEAEIRAAAEAYRTRLKTLTGERPVRAVG
jgi:glutathione-regulated potassium-efflux system ancillary protein KefG